MKHIDTREVIKFWIIIFFFRKESKSWWKREDRDQDQTLQWDIIKSSLQRDHLPQILNVNYSEINC